MATEILNAQITNTKLGEEHGCLTAELFIEGASWACTFGGYCLDHWYSDVGEHESTDGYGAIIELMKTLDVESWENLKGQYIRVETQGWGGNIVKVGHLIKDKWFSWKEYFDTAKKLHKQAPGED